MRRWTTLLLLLVNTSHILSYEIEPITNTMLPVFKGTTYIIDSYYTIYYHINLTNIQTCLNQIEKTTLFLNQTIHQVKKTEMTQIILAKLNHTLITLNRLKTSLDHYTSTKLRTKRGLANFVGTAQKWLFGTLDAQDEIKYDNYMKTLEDNQNSINKDLNSQKQIMTKLAEIVDSELKIIGNNQKRILEKLEDLDLKSATILTAIYISSLNDNVNLELAQIESTFNNIQTAINFAQTGIMHYSILKYNDLEKILREIKSDKRIPFNNIIKYYETMYAQVSIQNDLVIFTIHIPLIDMTPFLLYKIYPVPIQNRTISINQSYLLSSNTKYFTTEDECPSIEGFHLCTLTKLTKDEPCLHLMLNLKGQCPSIPVVYKEKSVIRLSDNSIFIIPKEEQRVNFRCPDGKTIEIINQPSVIFPKDCETTIDELTFSKQNSEVIEFRLKLPTLPINIPKSNNDENIIEVEKIDHSLIKQARTQINALEIHTLRRLTHTDSYWKEYTIVTLVLVISIVIIVLVTIRLYKHKKNKPVKVNIELQDLHKDIISEKPTVFSET